LNLFLFYESKTGFYLGYRTSHEKYYIHMVVAGVMLLIKLSLSFSIYIKELFCRVETVSI
jgi:hypothetical protein